MSDTPIPAAARSSPATARNRTPILEVLKRHLPDKGLVLEIASGAGEHAAHFAAALPHLQWQPTDPDPEALASIAAWRKHLGAPNLLPPITLDASDPDGWPVERADALVNINMIHISPWAATQGLMKGAHRILQTGGVLYLYGPYLERDTPTAPSNQAFDLDLKARNPAWGLRNLHEVTALAAQFQLHLIERLAMPANNLSLIFLRR